ncbi:GerA spore germination protein [Thermincola ferriacetica]|uniref:GerA spore germination protein n=1 Tax=Thermincola ferriacetica TaxID=281456 RepID=A0A0L6W1Y3_9FIRM|nr:spore germination protein [Thermincola ferriacetica]KNZ69545.1 GerA spore germination protein [Thermincola ferriacetica]
MFRLLKHMAKQLVKNKNNNQSSETKEKLVPFPAVRKNLTWFKQVLNDSDDLIIREFSNADLAGIEGALLYLEGMVNNDIVNNVLLPALLRDDILIHSLGETEPAIRKDQIDKEIVPVGGSKLVDDLHAALLSLMSGDTLVLLEGICQIYVFETKGWKERETAEPHSERIVRGPQIAFVEKLTINMALIRRRSRNPEITFRKMNIGNESKTDIAVVYHRKKVRQQVLNELLHRINSLNINNLQDSGMLEDYIKDNPLSFFPQLQYTERPDKVVASIIEGRVGIIVDGSPMVLLAPAPLAVFFQSAEDYYENWQFGTIIRWTRFLAAFISTSLPALYIAIISYHPELLPMRLAFSIGATRLTVPFPAFVEALLMESILELLQEASIRLPQPVGQTIGIVGGLVIGQAAVQAGIISPIMVIIISITAISSFVLPAYNFNLATRLIRVPFILSAVFLGFYGLVLAWLTTLAHLCQLKTMGASYMEGITPFSKKSLDTIIRTPKRLTGK